MSQRKHPKVPFGLTQYGFEYGAAQVTRIASDQKKGWIVLEVRTPKTSVQLYVTKTGKLRLFNAQREEVNLP